MANTYTEESVEGGYTREKEESTTENKMERRVSTRFEKYWTESGRADGQRDVEKKDHIPATLHDGKSHATSSDAELYNRAYQ